MVSQRIEPGPGQESVWDYPRPPRVEPISQEVRVEFAGTVIARSTRSVRVLETSSPPTVYIPSDDVRTDLLVPRRAYTTYCEWKGRAAYFDVVVSGRRTKRAAWHYPTPKPEYRELQDHVSFYAGRVDACFIGDERVTPQPGSFYGGWITSNIVGPFKGAEGTLGW